MLRCTLCSGLLIKGCCVVVDDCIRTGYDTDTEEDEPGSSQLENSGDFSEPSKKFARHPHHLPKEEIQPMS